MTDSTPQLRTVGAHLEIDVTSPADLVFAIAVASSVERRDESLAIDLDGRALDPAVIPAAHGGRIHQLRDVPVGRLTVDYAVTAVGAAPALPVGAEEWFQYIRPSRYCESDRLGPFARSEFGGLEGADLLAAVSSWVGSNLAYVPGSSRATDGAVNTLLARAGVCRDFAHLTVALLRANGVPARLVAVYAPGLDPMDFHAVAEACIGDRWCVVDPTCLAPRPSLLRIATGADAADTAFMTTVHGAANLADVEVTAVAEPVLPDDDVTELVPLR